MDDDQPRNTYFSENRERHARIVVRGIELHERRREAWAAKRVDHIDLRPPSDFQHPVTGRRELVPEPALVTIGRYLRRARGYAQKSQQRVSDETCVTQSMVSRAERGLAPNMGLAKLVRLCEALGRLFPLGTCPHDHDCAWQPIKPREHQSTAAERLIAKLLDPSPNSFETLADDRQHDRLADPPDEPLLSVTLQDLSVTRDD